MDERKKKEKDLSKKSFVCGRKNESNEINRKIKRFYRNGVHENVHENTFFLDIVLCTNVIRESRNNGSRKHFHHPPVYFFLLVYC